MTKRRSSRLVAAAKNTNRSSSSSSSAAPDVPLKKRLASSSPAKSSKKTKRSKNTRQQKSVDQLYSELFSKVHGDRIEWFVALQEWIESSSSDSEIATTSIQRVLYLGSYIHVGAAMVWPHVAMVDSDPKAAKFFGATKERHEEIVNLIVQRRQQQQQQGNNKIQSCKHPPSFRFLSADYNDYKLLRRELLGDNNNHSNGDDDDDDQDDEAPLFDLLISSYAGFVSRAGKDFTRQGGLLLANNSHGDASLAFVDSNDWKLVGVLVPVVEAAEEQDGTNTMTKSKLELGGNASQLKVSTQHLDEYMIPKKRRSKQSKRNASMESGGDVKPNHPSAAEILELGKGIPYTKEPIAYIFERLG